MKSRQVFLLIIATIVLFFSCNKKNTQNNYKSNSYNEQELSSAIQVFLSDTLNNVDSIFYNVYEKQNFKPFFVDANGIVSFFNDYYSQLAQIENDGMLPDKFNFNQLGILSEKIHQNPDIQKDSLALFDYLTLKSYLDLCAALQFGVINPKKTGLSNYFFEIKQVTPDFVENCIKNINQYITSNFESLRQHSENYKLIQKERIFYVNLLDSVFEKIPTLSDKKTIKFGEKHSSIPLIAKRLLLTNEISAADADSALNHHKFDSLLLKSINNFQEKRSIAIDNEIGNNTIRELNFPFKDLIKKIDVNLERMRWIPALILEGKYIRVNIANQILTAYNADSVKLQMKVCVGQEPDHLTPFIHSNIYDITLNPLWRVPQSIIIDEIATKAAPAKYIRANRMKVFRTGVEQNPDSINWRTINKKFCPYTIAQDSGSFNALGRIKFNMLNNFSVYLHDTNAKSAFSLNKRNISHGCVRVEKPLELAYFCLPEMSKQKFDLMRDKILFSIERQPISEEGKRLKQTSANSLKIRNISISPQIPVLLEYYTVFVNQNGQIIFCNDIYNLDEQLYKKTL
ncbi:MAG: L,D-transpeptidase family protein [Paludibacter sp.]|nr:L,D-transpeptidase family protein [Paludibacter sp.]